MNALLLRARRAAARRRLALAAALVIVLAAGRTRAQAPIPAPILQEIVPPGGVPGATTRVELVGRRLAKVEALLFNHPGISAVPAPPGEQTPGAAGDERKEEKKDGKKEAEPPAEPPVLVWDIAVDPSVPPGLYDLRASNALGVSAPRAFQVAPLPFLAGRDPRGSETAAVEWDRRIAGYVEQGEVERFRFQAPRPARVVVECLGERLDSLIDATLEVFDARGRRVAFSADRLGLDPALAFDAAEGVEYTIELWDLTYGGKYPYVLSLSTAPRVLFAFPAAAAAAGDAEVTFYGWNLPGSRPVEAPGGPLEALAARLTNAAAPAVAYRRTSALTRGAVEAGPPGVGCEPLLLASVPAPCVIESEPDDAPAAAKTLSPPFDLAGRFDAPGDRDWYGFEARKGQVLEIEVASARLGAPCDPLLLVARIEKRKDGDREVDAVRDLAYLEGRRTNLTREEAIKSKFAAAERDPLVWWTAPDDGKYLLEVRNRNGRSGIDATYVLSLREARGDFELFAIHSENSSGEGVTLPRGGSQSIDVLIERRGDFKGEVTVSAEGLPPGVTCEPVHAAPGESFVPLVFAAAPDAADWTGPVKVTGVSGQKGVSSQRDAAGENGGDLRREAWSAVMVYGGRERRHPFQYVHSRLARSTVLAVREAAPFAVKFGGGPLEVPPGAKVSIPVEIARREGFKEGVGFALQGLRQKAAPNDNGEREAKMTVAGDKDKGAIELTVPQDEPYGERTVVAYATALVEGLEDTGKAKAKKTKLRHTYATSPITVKVSPPVKVEIQAASAALSAGGSLKLPVAVRRLAGVDEPVELSVKFPDGAKGFAAAPVTLAKDQAEGEIVITSDIDAPPGPLEGAIVQARVRYAGKGFDERVLLPGAIERTAPLRLEALALETRACRGSTLAVPFRLELAAEVGATVTVALKPPDGLQGVQAAPVVLAPGASSGELALRVSEAPAGGLSGLALVATAEKGGKKFTTSAPLPAVEVVPAFELLPAAWARWGVLRLELKRHPALRPDGDVPIQVGVTARSGAQAAAAALLSRDAETVAVLVDVAALESVTPRSALFPLRLEIATAGARAGLPELKEVHELTIERSGVSERKRSF